MNRPITFLILLLGFLFVFSCDEPKEENTEEQKILYVSIMNESDDLYIMDIDGGNRKNLTNTPTIHESLYFPSHDGNSIFYGVMGDIYMMNLSTKEFTNLTNTPHEFEIEPDLSPNGEYLIFRSSLIKPPYISEIHKLNIESKVRSFLYGSGVNDDSEPKFSPDGLGIVFCSDEPWGFGEIYTYNLMTDSVTNLSNTRFEGEWNPNYFPDGQSIIYRHRDSTGYINIYKMNTDGTNQQQLTDNSYRDVDPVISNDGTKIVYKSETGTENYQTFIMDSNGSNISPLTISNSFIRYSFSSDDSELLFSMTVNQKSDIFRYIFEDSSLINLTNNEISNDFTPFYVP